MTAHPLDNAAYASLTGPHAYLAERHGRALRYPVDVCPFVALPHPPDEDAWADLAALAGADSVVPLPGIAMAPPDWAVVNEIPGVQMVDSGVVATPDPEAVPLGATDMPEMLDLVARTQPGPFRPRAVELGTYLGIRYEGRLVAMAGERLRPPGWSEISAVCTDPDFRGRGLAGRLIRAVAAVIRERGEIPFLHAMASNTSAIRLYEALGFTLRRPTVFLVARVPAGAVTAEA